MQTRPHTTPHETPHNTLVVSSSPREDGNSHVLARAALEGARAAGHDVEHVFLDEYVQRMLDNS
ncbi:NAD(P)H-dependent oxidoreductase [Mycolicibacterium agri]|uniref:NAD(P)H-dependent oxidoreductase n=1 Tax=Mycolicibacterium agri TaxID=36811 RepID=UPI001580F43B|nr:NAD(P)H-dependent oxidoreductase [Mycolicibacterium agri]